MRIRKLLPAIVSTLLLLQNPTQALASLIEGDLFTPGDSLLTLDETTQLEWLDVPETLFISVDDILADTGGWISLGFRYATTLEVEALMIAAGLTDLSGTASTGQFAAADYFVSLLGNTSGNTFNDATAGRAGIGDFGPGTVNVPIVIASGSGVGSAEIDHDIGMTVSFGGTNSSGSFLVREYVAPVPIPTPLLLFSSGFFCMLAGISRRKSAKS